MKNVKIYKKCLIIIDMVKGFADDGDLSDKTIMEAVPRQIELIKEYKKDNELIIFIRDFHTKDSVEHDRFGKYEHCNEGTPEVEIIDELKPYTVGENVIIIDKNCTSFMEVDLMRGLVKNLENVNIYDLIGCCTDICVTNGALGLMNCLDQINRRALVRLHEDGIETFNSPNHNREKYSEAAYLLLEQQGAKRVRKIGEMKYGK